MDDLKFKIGSVNPSGISDEVYFIPKHHIKRWPTIVDDFERTLAGQYAEYEDNFVLQPDRHWSRLYSTQGKGKISWGYEGERDCRVVINKALMVYPKITTNSRAFAKQAANGDFVFIARHDRKYYVIGSPTYRAVLTPNGESGDAPGSEKGITVNIECPDTTPLPTYIGTLLLEDGVIDCETDTFINYSDMSTNVTKTLQVENNQVVFNALSDKGRIQLEGSGTIIAEVSVDGVNYAELEHDAAFENGYAVVPIYMVIGDYIRISATSLTSAIINFNNVAQAERNK